MKNRIRITNPVQDGAHRTSQRKAAAYVASGRAAYADASHLSITFAELDHRHIAAVRSVAQRLADYGYDRIGRVMLPAHMSHLPMTGDPIKSLMRRTKSGPGATALPA